MEIVHSIVESLAIDPKVVLAQAISFLVLLFLLIKFMYKPIGSMLEQRQQQVKNQIANAEEQREHAESLRQLYEGHLANIAEEARAKMDQMSKDAEVHRQRLISDAQAVIHENEQRHQAQLVLEREQLRRELRNEMSEIAVMAATKVLRTQLTPTLQSAIIDQVIRDIDHPSLKVQ